ncbi:hypothetical protein WT39_23990 [Burkholderia territorii]|nr:hypothetical protein WT39_23990 [Burkholderia territorii]
MRRGNARVRRGTAVSRERVSASGRWRCGIARDTRAAAGAAPMAAALHRQRAVRRSDSTDPARSAFATGLASEPPRIPHTHANATE